MQKFPHKMNFQQNQHQWMNNFTDLKQKNHPQNSNMGFPVEQPPDLPPLDPSKSTFWNDQPNMCNLNGNNPLGNSESSLDDKNVNVPCLVPNSPCNTGEYYYYFFFYYVFVIS